MNTWGRETAISFRPGCSWGELGKTTEVLAWKRGWMYRDYDKEKEHDKECYLWVWVYGEECIQGTIVRRCYVGSLVNLLPGYVASTFGDTLLKLKFLVYVYTDNSSSCLRYLMIPATGYLPSKKRELRSHSSRFLISLSITINLHQNHSVSNKNFHPAFYYPHWLKILFHP